MAVYDFVRRRRALFPYVNWNGVYINPRSTPLPYALTVERSGRYTRPLRFDVAATVNLQDPRAPLRFVTQDAPHTSTPERLTIIGKRAYAFGVATLQEQQQPRSDPAAALDGLTKEANPWARDDRCPRNPADLRSDAWLALRDALGRRARPQRWDAYLGTVIARRAAERGKSSDAMAAPRADADEIAISWRSIPRASEADYLVPDWFAIGRRAGLSRSDAAFLVRYARTAGHRLTSSKARYQRILRSFPRLREAIRNLSRLGVRSKTWRWEQLPSGRHCWSHILTDEPAR